MWRVGRARLLLIGIVCRTEQHRYIWEESQNNQKLARIRDPKADLYTKPVTLLMFHLHCWYRTIQEWEVSVLEGLELDIKNFFNRPIPKHVWSERKAFFDSDFRQFVDCVLKK